MEHNSYIARRRAKFSGIGGIPVNIPYGTALEVREGFILKTYPNKLMVS